MLLMEKLSELSPLENVEEDREQELDIDTQTDQYHFVLNQQSGDVSLAQMTAMYAVVQARIKVKKEPEHPGRGLVRIAVPAFSAFPCDMWAIDFVNASGWVPPLSPPEVEEHTVGPHEVSTSNLDARIRECSYYLSDNFVFI